MFKVFKIVTSFLLVVALADWPYDYYTLLRIVTFVTGVWGSLRYYKDDYEGLAVGFGIVGLLFNPIFPIYLERSTWAFIDIGAALFLLFSLWVDWKNKP